MANTQKKKLRIFMELEITYWLLYSTMGSFAISYLQDRRGLSDGTASMLLLVRILGAVLGQILLARLCDYFQTHKKVLYFTCLMILPMGMGLYFSTGLTGIILFSFLFGAFQNPLSLILDTWILQEMQDCDGAYGKIRAAGAISYAASSTLFGKILDAFGYTFLITGMAAFAIIFLVLASMISENRSEFSRKSTWINNAAEKKEPQKIESKLFTPAFIFLLGILFVTGMCANEYSFLPMLMAGLNGSLTMYGLCMTGSGIGQFPILIAESRLNKLSPWLRVCIAGALYVITALFYALSVIPAGLVFAGFLSGVAYGLILPAMRQLASSLSPDGYHTTAQGIVDAVYQLVSTIFTMGAGSFADFVGLKPIILVIAGIESAAVILCLIRTARNAWNKSAHLIR